MATEFRVGDRVLISPNWKGYYNVAHISNRDKVYVITEVFTTPYHKLKLADLLSEDGCQRLVAFPFGCLCPL